MKTNYSKLSLSVIPAIEGKKAGNLLFNLLKEKATGIKNPNFKFSIVSRTDFNRKDFPGYDHFIGKEEKRRTENVLHFQFPFTFGNYAFFYKKTERKAILAGYAIMIILHKEQFSNQIVNLAYSVIIQCLHIVHHKSSDKQNSKLDGINSLSTSCMDNSYCLARMKSGDSICSHCYASSQQKMQLALQDCNTLNGIILRNIEIPSLHWKKHFPKSELTEFFRIESFGDVQNKLQAVNYLHFAKAFPMIHFAVWTKNKIVYTQAFLVIGKPENLSYIVSSNRTNHPEIETLEDENVNHLFTVYDKSHIVKHGIKINCGGKSCKQCINAKVGCYFTNTEKVINEELK